MRRLSIAGLLLLVSVAAAGCGTERRCGEGTKLEGGSCVPVGPGGPACGEGTTLVAGLCVPAVAPDAGSCLPSCVERECGPDGCGGSCGTCTTAAAPTCNEQTGRCEALCVPRCAGKNCGPDGCGGSCGTCGAGLACAGAGRCVPTGWTCDPAWYGAGDACDCECGVADSDCAQAGMPVSGCEAAQVCSAAGKCVARVPAAWSCAPQKYDAHDACDCGCGAPDPDCAFSMLQVLGCARGVNACNADGTCPTCTPNCTDKVCGDDGCGGVCGICNDPQRPACVEGVCRSACDPTPVRCATADCGDDGCGGVCGTCAAGSSCQSGRCVRDQPQVGPNSCVGRCGSAAPGGCYCTATCAASGSCCPDVAQACACTPNCTGKTCGPDGCGGTCGSCGGATPHCSAAGRCTAQCTPDCAGRACGDDGCGGSCGSCGEGRRCLWTRQCLPDLWSCDPFLYADRMGCDCGCGAPDPDCAESDARVYGCATRTTRCTGEGLCEQTFCASNADCTAGRWCTGLYHAGGGRFGGSCDAPDDQAFAPGSPCSLDAACATGVCLAGTCRQYCRSDEECPTFQTCLAQPVLDATTRALRGYAGVCERIAGSAAACASQAACAASAERCIAVASATTLDPRYLCADVREAGALGRDCAMTACPAGYTCASSGGARVCSLPCPGGAADCPTGFRCERVEFTTDATASRSMPACVPN